MNEQTKGKAPVVDNGQINVLKTYRKQYSDHCEVIEVNMETGEFRQFFYSVHDGQLLIFSDRTDNLQAMGWKSAKDYIKQRAKKLYPEELKDGFDLNHMPRFVPPNKVAAAAQ
ncbi:MAG: hypothetical protein K0Q73_9290 [Paenibacillus sp.]|nr:hypothetical protein [Paenibacillus sp.]